MSLESNILALIKAVEANTAAITGTQVKAAPVSTPVVTQAEAAALAAPVAVVSVPTANIPATSIDSHVAAVQMHPMVTPVTVQMPATPTFTATAAPVTGIPFNDAASVMAYTVGKYNSLGKEKGMKISDVLASLGVATLTDLKPEHYPHYYAAVEAI